MPRIEKRSPFLGLSRYQTFIVDTNPNSKYFKLSEVPDELTAGKNAFLIEGTPFLKPTTEIKIEVLDVNGNPLFVEPGEGIPEYYEGLSKVISIHVYSSTPIGIGKITILGELQTYEDETGNEVAIPGTWEGIYNVKWEKEIKINKNVGNETRVRFLKRPTIIVEETGESFYSRNVATAVQSNGTVRGIAVTPEEGTDLTTWRGGVQYLIENESADFVDNGKTISVAGTAIQSASIVEYLNQRNVIVQVPHTSSDNTLATFSAKSYGLNYEYVSSIAESSLFGSFARFEINNLKTFVGDVERLKVYAKSRATSADYTLLHDTKIDSSNLLTTVISGSTENLGYFTSSYANGRPYTYYWTTQSSAGITLDSQAIYKAIKFQNNKVSSNLGNDIRLEKDSEYTLQFYVYYSGSAINQSDVLKVYMSSTTQTSPYTINYRITSSIVTLSGSSVYKTPQKLSYNFVPPITDDWTINFESVNPNADTYWHVGSIVLEGSNELGYSPDEYTFTIPIQRQIEQETFDFNFEWYDINNNFVPIQNTVTQTFVSGNITLLGKNLAVDADKLFFTFDQNSTATPTSQTISINATKTKLNGNLLITSQAYDSGGIYLPPASFLGTSYPGRLTSTYEDTNAFSASLTVSNFTGSLHGTPPGPGNVIVDRILYTFTEPNSTQPQIRRLSVSRVLTNAGTGSQGAAGQDAKTVNLVSNIYAIPYNSDGVEAGVNNIWLTASAQNHQGTVYYEFLKNDVTKQNTTSNYYNVLTADKPNTGSRDSWKVNTREGSGVGSVIAFDTIDIFGLKDGVNGYTIFFTNGATTFPADEFGTVDSSSLSAGTTDIIFLRGTSSFTYDQSSPYDLNSYRTGSITASSTISYSSSIVNNGLRFTPTAINTIAGTVLTGSINVPLIDNYTNIPFNIVYTYSVSKAGRSGSNALSVFVNPSTQTVSRSKAGAYQSPATFSIQVFETGSALRYTGSNNTLQNGYFTVYLSTGAGTLIPATASFSASIAPPLVTSDFGASSSFAIQYRDSKGNLSGYVSQSHFVIVIRDGNDGINGASGSDARAVSLISDRYTFTYDQNGTLTPLTAQTASLTASAQTGSVSWGANIFYEFVKNGVSKITSNNQYYIITGSEIPSAGSIDIWQVNLRSGSAQTVVAFDNIDIFGLKSGSDAYTVFLTNEAHTFTADDQGNVSTSNLASGFTDIRFFRGTTQYTYNQAGGTNTYRTGSITASFNITASQTIVNNDVRFTPTNVTGSTQTSGSIIIPVIDNVNNITFTKTYSFSISKAGASGSNALSILLNPSNQSVSKSKAGAYQPPVTFSIQIFETGSALRYTGSNNTLQNGYFTVYLPNGAGTLTNATASLSASIAPTLVTTDSGVSSSFAIQYRDSKGNLSSFISQSHYVGVVRDGNDGINGTSGSDARAVILSSDRYAFTYDQNGNLSPLTAQTASLTASAQTGSGANPWGANVFYQFLKNGVTKITSANPFYIITGSEIPPVGGRDFWQVNLLSGSGQTLVAFDNIDIFALRSGSDAYTVFLTNEAHTFVGDDLGNVSSANLTAGTTDLRFFRGTTQYTYNQTGGSGTYKTGSLISSSNITVSQTIVNNDLRIIPTSVSGLTQLTGSVTIPVTDNITNTTFTKIFTFGVSKAGTSGSNALSILLNPTNQSVSKSKAGAYQPPVTFSIQVFETGSALRYTGSNNTLQNGFFTVYLPNGAGTLINATASLSASIAPTLVTTDSGVSSSFAIQYRDSRGNLSSFISQSHYVAVIRDGNDGINGASGSDARAVSLTSDRYTFTYDQNGNLASLAQTASLTASAQTGSGANPWGANVFYQFLKNGVTKITSANPFYIITGSEIPPVGARDFWQVNLLSGSGQTLVSFDNIDIFALRSGSDAYTVFLTNEAHTFVGDDLGNVSSANLTPGTTDIRFFRGTTQYTYNQTGGTNTYKTGSLISSSNITVTQTIVNNDLRIIPTSVTGLTQLTGSVTIPVTDNATNTTFTKIFTFGISKAGTSGSNGVTIIVTPETQMVTQSVYYNTFSSASKFDVFVYETGSALSYTTSQPPTVNSTFTIYTGSNAQTNISVANNKSGSIRPPHSTTSTGSVSLFAVQYRDSRGNVSAFISASHIVTVNPTGVTGPGVVFTGPWSSSYFYQYSPGANNGRRDVVYETGSGRYYATLQEHTSNGSNRPTGTTSDNAFWQHLGTQDLFVAAKVAIFQDSYVQNTLNVGTNNTGFSAANITIAGGTQNPYIAIGQSSVGYGNTGIWIGNDGGNYRTSFVSAGGNGFLRWDGSRLFISGNISASEGRIGGVTIANQSLYVGAGQYASSSTGFLLSSSGDFSLKDSVIWNNSDGTFNISKGSISIGTNPTSTVITTDGQLRTQNANIGGRITATDGAIGGWTINASNLVASSSQGIIRLDRTGPSISIFSGSSTSPAVDINTRTVLSDTGSTSLGITGSDGNRVTSALITSSIRIGSSDNNTGGDISNRYTTVNASYSSGSTTRLTGSWSASFTIPIANDNKFVTINIGSVAASASLFSASFSASVDPAYYISSTTFTMRYGFALYSSSTPSSPPDVFIDSVSTSGTGTSRYSSGLASVVSNISYGGTLNISRTLSSGRYHLIPYVELINASATATEIGGGCGCPSAGTFAYYGDCITQQEYWYYNGTCDGRTGTQFNGCDVYVVFSGNCA